MGTQVDHGGCSWESKFDIVQHGYAWADDHESHIQGYIEILEIKDPPNLRKGNVIHICLVSGEFVWLEFNQKEEAISAYQLVVPMFRKRTLGEVLAFLNRQAGCIGVSHTKNKPWFYA